MRTVMTEPYNAIYYDAKQLKSMVCESSIQLVLKVWINTFGETRLFY